MEVDRSAGPRRSLLWQAFPTKRYPLPIDFQDVDNKQDNIRYAWPLQRGRKLQNIKSFFFSIQGNCKCHVYSIRILLQCADGH